MVFKPMVFPCNTCSIKFTTSELQRSHMRQSWHISNLRLRVDGLPALSEEVYDERARDRQRVYNQEEDQDEHNRQTQDVSHEFDAEIDERISENIPLAEDGNGVQIPPTQCLFCPLLSSSLTANINHMASLHGLFIPSPHRLANPASLLGYLAIIIFDDNECLYCGLAKRTAAGAQTHMRAKGHCMLNLNADTGLLDFWDTIEADDGDERSGESQRSPAAAIKLSPVEMRLPSGTVITSRSETTQLRVKPRQRGDRKGDLETRALSIEDLSEGQAPRQISLRRLGQGGGDHRVAVVRGELGLSGLSASARRALQVVAMKMKRREVGVKAASRYAAERQPVKTKYYKTETPIYQAG